MFIREWGLETRKVKIVLSLSCWHFHYLWRFVISLLVWILSWWWWFLICASKALSRVLMHASSIVLTWWVKKFHGAGHIVTWTCQISTVCGGPSVHYWYEFLVDDGDFVFVLIRLFLDRWCICQVYFLPDE